jgi:hypothetical protein
MYTINILFKRILKIGVLNEKMCKKIFTPFYNISILILYILQN